MNNYEINLLIGAKNEIMTLRKIHEIQSAQLRIVDVFAAAVGLRKNEDGFATIDIVSEIDKKIKESKKDN